MNNKMNKLDKTPIRLLSILRTAENNTIKGMNFSHIDGEHSECKREKKNGKARRRFDLNSSLNQI